MGYLKKIFSSLGSKVPHHFYCQLSSQDAGKGVDALASATVHDVGAEEADQPSTAIPVRQKLTPLINATLVHPSEHDDESVLELHQSDKMIHVQQTTVAPEEDKVSDTPQETVTVAPVKLHRVHLIRTNHTVEELEKVFSIFYYLIRINHTLEQLEKVSSISFLEISEKIHRILSIPYHYVSFFMCSKDYDKLNSGLTYMSQQHNHSLPVLSFFRKLDDDDKLETVVLVNGHPYEIHEIHLIGKNINIRYNDVTKSTGQMYRFFWLKIKRNPRESNDSGSIRIRLFMNWLMLMT